MRLPARLLNVFVVPGALGDALAREPRWGGALLLGAACAVGSTLLIPQDIWQEMLRTQLLASGQEVPPELFARGGRFFMIGALFLGLLGWVLWTFLVAGVTGLLFGLLLGDEGRFRHYLAASTHALLIPAVGTLLTVPLRIARRDVQLTLSVGTFLGGGTETWLERFLSGLDLFLLWGVAVLALLVSRIDTRRSWRSAAVPLYVLLLAFTALLAVIPRPG